MATSELQATHSGQRKLLGGPVFQLWTLLRILGVPLLVEAGAVINANALSRWTPGPEQAAEWGDSMATGVTGEPMGNQIHN